MTDEPAVAPGDLQMSVCVGVSRSGVGTVSVSVCVAVGWGGVALPPSGHPQWDSSPCRPGGHPISRIHTVHLKHKSHIYILLLGSLLNMVYLHIQSSLIYFGC